MKRVGFLTASCMLKGSPDLRDDHHEHELEFALLRAACLERNISLEEVVWQEGQKRAADFDAFVIGTVWDYAEHEHQFLETLTAVETHTPLFNPLAAVRWNLKKSYLKMLQHKGVNIVPTLFVQSASDDAIRAAFKHFACERVVAKPLVGACAWRQVAVHKDESYPPLGERPPGEAMIQPFLDAAQNEGEYSFIFVAKRFSHCVLKVPAAGDYRVQSVFGGQNHTHTPSADDLAIAQSVLEAIDFDLLYARVDMMRDARGALALMELEIIEPYLYPEQGERLGELFAELLNAKLSEL